jgi:predicted nucleic acid-binding protein
VSYLIDTNIISELVRSKPDVGVLQWAARVDRHAVSAVSVEEIWYGLARRPSVRLQEWMQGYFQRHEVLPVSALIAQRAGELRGEFSRHGITRLQADMLIAATAQIHGLTLVTRNVCDFEGCGIGLLNPFSLIPEG